MLPNKRNPDPAELVRARSARVIGSLTGMLVVLKGLPLGYQRDLQEDKAPLFESVRILRASLVVMAGVVAGLQVDEARMRDAVRGGYLTAVSAADTLTELGIAFRSAHHVLGGLVRIAEERRVGLEELLDEEIVAALAGSEDPIARTLAGQSDIGSVVRRALSVDAALSRPDVIGGTAPARVEAELAAAAARLGIE
jgi:argininosuccinate lyase